MLPLTTQLRQRLLPILLGQTVGFACGVIGVKLVSHLVPPATLGAYGVFLTFSTIGMWVVHAGVIKFVSRHWVSAENRSLLLHATLLAWFRKLGWLTLVAAGAAAATSRLAAVPAWLVFLPLLVASSLLALGALFQTALQAAREHWRDFAVAAAGSVTRTFAPLLLFVVLGRSAAGLYLGFCIHALTLTVVGAWILRKHSSNHGPRQQLPAITPVYDGPLFTVLAISGWILSGQNRWLTAWFFDPTVAGYFVLASNIALAVPSVLGAIFIQFSQPIFYALADAGGPNARRLLARRVDLAAGAFCLFSLLGLGLLHKIAPLLVGSLINENYRGALVWIFPAGCFSIATATAYFYHTLLLAGRREHACGPVDLSTAALLTMGGFVAASCGQPWFERALVLMPLVPWLVTRPLARWYLFRPVAGEDSATGQ